MLCQRIRCYYLAYYLIAQALAVEHLGSNEAFVAMGCWEGSSPSLCLNLLVYRFDAIMALTSQDVCELPSSHHTI
jgi:hypothetical protein